MFSPRIHSGWIASLLLLTTAKSDAAINTYFTFDNVDSPSEVFDEKQEGAPIRLSGQTSVATEDPKFGAGCIEVGNNESAARCGWFIPLKDTAWAALNEETDRFTLATWIKAPDPTSILFLRRTPSGGSKGGFVWMYASGRLQLKATDGEGNGGQMISEKFDLPANEWMHLAVTLHENVVTFYVNGEAYPGIGTFASVPAGEDGHWSTLLDAAIGTKVDDMVVFTREALSDETVRALYEKGAAATLAQ